MADCEDRTFESENGLQFNVTCNSDNNARPYFDSVYGTIEQCMEECSLDIGPGDGACFGIIYDIETRTCTFTVQGTQDSEIRYEERPSRLRHMARANVEQLQPLELDCPYEDGSRQTTSNGAEFRIYCDRWYDDEDHVDFENQEAVHIFRDTMEGCMEACATSIPLCLAIYWNPSLSDGYGNCHAFNTINETKLDQDINSSHAAFMSNFRTDAACEHDSTFVADGDVSYRISCDVTASGPTVANVRTPNLNACAQQCADFRPNSTTLPCAGVVYEFASTGSGLNNCFLKSAIEDERESAGFGMAVLGTGSSSSSPSPSPSRPSPRAGVVAGTVLGALALVSLAAGAWWWRRRRLRQRAAAEGNRDVPGLHEAHSAVPSELPGSEEKREIYEIMTPPRAESRSEHSAELASPEETASELHGDMEKDPYSGKGIAV